MASPPSAAEIDRRRCARTWGAGKTAALLGSSGVGKSSIANALLGEERLRTHEVRDSRQPRTAHDAPAGSWSLAAGRRHPDRHARHARAAVVGDRRGASPARSPTSRRSPKSAASAIAATAPNQAARCSRRSRRGCCPRRVSRASASCRTSRRSRRAAGRARAPRGEASGQDRRQGAAAGIEGQGSALSGCRYTRPTLAIASCPGRRVGSCRRVSPGLCVCLQTGAAVWRGAATGGRPR